MRSDYLFTSESVSEGHPDKVSDQISDAIVDLFLSKDPRGARRLRDADDHPDGRPRRRNPRQGHHGYRAATGRPASSRRSRTPCAAWCATSATSRTASTGRRCSFENNLHPQSAHIAQGVDAGDNKDEGAGDQGIMFGFACDETPDLMPATLDYSHKILERMAADRHSGAAPFLEPDAKSQVTLRFRDGKPVAATAIVVSTQHAKGYDEGEQEAELHNYVKGVVADVLPRELLTNETVYHINPTGSFEIGGPDGDAGLTGRKIIVDTYGGAAPHGGGAFSGKDPTKVDRSAAYVTRYLAKNVVAAGLARRCTIQIAYAIGVSQPLSLYVDTHGTGTVADEKLEAAITGGQGPARRADPARHPQALGLNKPIYRKTAAYGHFGRNAEGDVFPWEKTDLVDALKAAAA